MSEETCTLQLRNLVTQVERAISDKEAVERISTSLVTLGRRWPDGKLAEEASKHFDRLARQLPKFADAQQQGIIAACRPLRDLAKRWMADTTAALESWLNEVPHHKKAPPQRLAELLQSVAEAPLLRCYKQCADLEIKTRFLWVAACTLRAAQNTSGPFHSHMAGHAAALASVKRIVGSLFTLPEHGCVLNAWHDGRLQRYDATLWRAGKTAANRFKDELQERLVAAVRGAPGATVSKNAKPQVQLALREWPMIGCPLARALLDFVMRRKQELGDLGQPRLNECPPHSLRPATLRRLLALLDAFEVVDAEGNADGCPGVVRLKPEAAAALAFKAVGTKPKAAPTAPTLAGAAKAPARPPVAATVAAASPRAVAADGVATATAAAGAISAVAGLVAGPRKALAPVVVGSTGPSSTMGATPGGATKMVRRRIDWKNSQALLRLVRRGFRAGDKEWAQIWQDYCKTVRIAADSVQGTGPPKEHLEEFVEKNLPTLVKKEWAKDLMYKAEGQGDELPPESDVETGGAESTEMAGVSTPTQETRKEAAMAAIAGKRTSRSRGSSSASDSSRSRRRKRRREKKRKMGSMMGFGYDFTQGQTMTPEVLMMNQMMGMSLMMNNPMAMMGMGAPMMAHQMPMMQVGGNKLKKDDKGKRPRAEDAPNSTTGPAAAAPAAGAPKQQTQAAASAAASAEWGKRKDQMIDADDL